MGCILHNMYGKGAKRKLGKRRLDVISGNVTSCTTYLNNPKHLNQIQEVNQITATVAEVIMDMDKAKVQKKKTLHFGLLLDEPETSSVHFIRDTHYSQTKDEFRLWPSM